MKANFRDIIEERLKLQAVQKNLATFKVFGVSITNVEDVYSNLDAINKLDDKRKRKLVAELVGSANTKKFLTEI